MRTVLSVALGGAVVIGAALFSAQAQDSKNSRESDLRLSECIVSVIEEVQVPAEEPGALKVVAYREGKLIRGPKIVDGKVVAEGDLLARMDDTRAQTKKRAASIEKAKAGAELKNDISVRYAEAQAKVAKAAYDKALAANAKVPGTFPDIEVLKLELEWDAGKLQIEQAQHKQRLTGYDVLAREEDVKAAEEEISRRQIRSPIDGVVITAFRRQGEWVQAGDPVVKIMRMDRLRIEGRVNIKDYSPDEVKNRPVTVSVNLTGGKTETFKGEVVFAHPEVNAAGEYAVWAEVDNRLSKADEFLLRPGLLADMTIHTAAAKVAEK